MSNVTAKSYLMLPPLSHPIPPQPPCPLSLMKNYKPLSVAKLIGLATLDELLYPQIILALMKRASIATAWGISKSIVSSTPVLPASAMPLTTSKTAAHSAVATIQPVPYSLHLLHPIILLLLWEQSIWCLLC